jgi:hypothetical protein
MTHKTSILAAAIVLLPIGMTGGDAFCDSPGEAAGPACPRTVYCLEEIRAIVRALPSMDQPALEPLTISEPDDARPSPE